MKSVLIALIVVFRCAIIGYSQCDPIDFDLPTGVCRQSQFQLFHGIDGDSFAWDFCTGDLTNAGSANQAFRIGAAVGRPSIDLVKTNGMWIAFLVGTWTNSLHRVEFGDGLAAAPTKIDNLGDLNGTLNSPGQIRMVFANGEYHGVIHNTGSGELLKITLDSALKTVVSTTVLASGFGYQNAGLAIDKDPVNGWVALLSKVNSMSMIRLGEDLSSAGVGDIIETAFVPGSNNLGDVDLVKVCGVWYGAAVNFGGGNTYLFNFGTDLFSLPQIDQIASLPISNGGRLRFARDGENYYLLVSSLDGIWHKIAFGNVPHANPNIENEGNLNGALQPNTYGLAAVIDNSTWNLFSVDQANGQVYRITYPQPCAANVATSSEAFPNVAFNNDGEYQITLESRSGNNHAVVTKNLVVKDDDAPDIAILSENNCANHEVNFELVNSSANITSLTWDFHDGSDVETEPAPVHTFSAAGNYIVSLDVMSTEGCRNSVSRVIAIYPEPNASFDLPQGVLCTNTELSIENTTDDVYEGLLTHEWSVNGNAISSERDLEFTFASTGIFEISLRAAIPGCFDEFSMNTSEVRSGPTIEFDFQGHCKGVPIDFYESLSEEVSSLHWNFGDDNNAEGSEPSHSFQQTGLFNVTLTAVSPNGCHNTVVQQLQVDAVPVVDFDIEPPPQSCSNAENRFINLSSIEGNETIEDFTWQFGDPGQTTSQAVEPFFIYSSAGDYSVSLTATSLNQCSASRTKVITIFPQPEVEIDWGPSCVSRATSFAAEAENIMSYYWEIGTSYYESQNPAHTFSAPGDYQVLLTVTGENGCMSTRERTINVPPVLQPNFSFVKNCVGHEAFFTNTTPEVDPVKTYRWSTANLVFGNEPTAQFVFNSLGQRSVTLTLETHSGCTYSTSRTVPIIAAPHAQFSASTYSGALPLEVEFYNESSNANSFIWSYGNGTTSEDFSPDYTFNELGDFLVELIAKNPQGCESSMLDVIHVEEPQPDVAIKLLSFIDNPNGTLKAIITLQNKGNTVIRNLPVEIDISGTVKLTETVQEAVRPATQYNLVLDYGIHPANGVRYLCARTFLENDLDPEGDRSCREFDDAAVVLSPYPNPATTHVQIEWIASAETSIAVELTDVFGKIVLQKSVASVDGLNTHYIDVRELREGIYILRLNGGIISRSERILVSGSK